MPVLHKIKRVPHHAKRAHHSLVTLPTLLIIVGIVLSAGASIYMLRLNNLGVLPLKEAVQNADKRGDGEQLEQSLVALRHYVLRHMNTSSSVELTSSYERAVAEAQRDTARRLGNVSLYNQAERACRRLDRDSGTSLAECINSMLTGQTGDIVDLPNPALYRHNFVAPTLSLDLAGLTLIINSIFVYAGLHKFSGRFILPHIRGLIA